MKRARPAPAQVPDAVELARQKADFTSEGSPPPGQVANAAPVRPEATPAKRGAPRKARR